MKTKNKTKVFLVDDDSVFLKLMEIEFLQTHEYEIETYPTGELCIKNLDHRPDVIILDYLLDGIDKKAMNGIQTLDKIKEYDPTFPVVMLSSQDKIEVAIDCMHHKAFDYVVKSETAFIRIKKIIATILRYRKMEKELSWYMDRM
jgi:two-component system OmpR family response regulator